VCNACPMLAYVGRSEPAVEQQNLDHLTPKGYYYRSTFDMTHRSEASTLSKQACKGGRKVSANSHGSKSMPIRSDENSTHSSAATNVSRRKIIARKLPALPRACVVAIGTLTLEAQ